MHRSDDPNTQSAPDAAPGPGGAAEAGRAGEQAAPREQVWSFALQSLDHAILCIDTAQVVTWASPGAAKILGEPAGVMVGQSAIRFFTEEDIAKGIPMHEVAVALSQGSAEDDRWMTRADGSRFWASGMMTAIRDAEGAVTGFVKVLRNLTSMKMQLDTLHNRSEMLGAADHAKNRSIALLAHELRNPLSAASMSISILRQRTRGEPMLQPSVDILERSVGSAIRLVDDVEDASRVSAGKLRFQPASLVLHEVLQASLQAALSRVADSAPEVDLLLPAEPIILEADRLRLQQVFANLIGNAIKFTPASGHVWVNATVESAEAVVRVEDNGAGIAADKLESIFEMFTQACEPTESAGLGIGLAVVKEIMELHGGSIQARSDGIGKGSEFVVRLPLRQPAN